MLMALIDKYFRSSPQLLEQCLRDIVPQTVHTEVLEEQQIVEESQETENEYPDAQEPPMPQELPVAVHRSQEV